MRKMWMAWIILGACCLAGCSQFGAGAQGDAHELTEEDSGSTIQLREGERIIVKLPGNLTTGYSWEVEQMEAALLAQVGEREYDRDSKLIGAGEINTFTFEATGQGQSLLRLIYHRPFEPDAAPEKVFELTVVVK